MGREGCGPKGTAAEQAGRALVVACWVAAPAVGGNRPDTVATRLTAHASMIVACTV